MDSALFAYYNALIAVGVFVLYIYGEILYRKIRGKRFDLIFDFSLGVFLICAGTVASRLYFTTRRIFEGYGIDTSFLQNSPVLIILFFPLLMGYLWHIHTMTKAKYRWKVLTLAALSAVITFAVSCLLFPSS